MTEEDFESGAERKIILSPRTVGTMPTGNEHLLHFVGRGFTGVFDSNGYFTKAFAKRLNEIFPGSGNRGSRIEIYRQPTKEELQKLRDLARELGASVEIKVRNDEELEKEFRELRDALRQLRK